MKYHEPTTHYTRRIPPSTREEVDAAITAILSKYRRKKPSKYRPLDLSDMGTLMLPTDQMRGKASKHKWRTMTPPRPTTWERHHLTNKYTDYRRLA